MLKPTELMAIYDYTDDRKKQWFIMQLLQSGELGPTSAMELLREPEDLEYLYSEWSARQPKQEADLEDVAAFLRKRAGAEQSGENPDGVHTTTYYPYPAGEGRRNNRMRTDPQKIRQWTDQPMPDSEFAGGGNIEEDDIYNASDGNTSGTDLKDSDTDNIQFGYPDSRVRPLQKRRKGDDVENAAQSAGYYTQQIS